MLLCEDYSATLNPRGSVNTTLQTSSFKSIAAKACLKMLWWHCPWSMMVVHCIVHCNVQASKYTLSPSTSSVGLSASDLQIYSQPRELLHPGKKDETCCSSSMTACTAPSTASCTTTPRWRPRCCSWRRRRRRSPPTWSPAASGGPPVTARTASCPK